MYSMCGTAEPGGLGHCGNASGFAVNGWWILVVVSMPVIVSLIPVLIRRRAARIVSLTLLWIGCVLGLLSVGIFFLPAAILMTLAVAIPERVAAPVS